MADENRPDDPRPDDAEVDEMMRKLRPRRYLSALLTIGMALGALLVLTLLAYGVLDGAGPRSPSSAAPPRDAGANDEIEIDRELPALPLLPHMEREAVTTADQAVAIEAAAPDGDGSHYGSGVLIRDGVALTAAHIVGGLGAGSSYPVRVHCAEGAVAGHVLAYDELRDVMIVSAPGCAAERREFAIGPTRVADTLHVVGFEYEPGHAHRFHSYTSVVPRARILERDIGADHELAERMREMERQRVPHLFAIAGAADPGNSGSAVFDDQGRIVGVLVIRDTLHNRSYVVPATSVVQVLRANGLE